MLGLMLEIKRQKRGEFESNLDPANSAVREKGQLVAFFFSTKKISKTGIDKKIGQTPTRDPFSTQQKRHFVRSALSNGGPEGTRTPDLLRVKQALYQLSYRSVYIYYSK